MEDSNGENDFEQKKGIILNKKKGHLFFLVGNSGSGKDSLLKEAIDNWPDNIPLIKIPKRYITRLPHETEPFHSVSKEIFFQLKNAGFFSLTWNIYGLFYGIPNDIDKWLDNGENVIINVSRSIIPEALKKYPNLQIIFIQVPFEITLNRLKNRGRELENDPVFKLRVKRAQDNQIMPEAHKIIMNVNSIQEGGTELRDFLIKF